MMQGNWKLPEIQKNLHEPSNDCEKTHLLKTLLITLFYFLQDERLKKLVEQNGTDAWRLIANYFPVSK